MNKKIKSVILTTAAMTLSMFASHVYADENSNSAQWILMLNMHLIRKTMKML